MTGDNKTGESGKGYYTTNQIAFIEDCLINKTNTKPSDILQAKALAAALGRELKRNDLRDPKSYPKEVLSICTSLVDEDID